MFLIDGEWREIKSCLYKYILFRLFKCILKTLHLGEYFILIIKNLFLYVYFIFSEKDLFNIPAFKNILSISS